MDKKQHKRLQTHLLEELKKENATSFRAVLKFYLKLPTTTTNIFLALSFRIFFFSIFSTNGFVKKCLNTL